MADLLVIEDEESLLQTLRYNLARAGHEVRLCTDGLLGPEMVRENPPDLLLLDRMLPGLNGLDICRRVRREVSNPSVSRLPILVLTAGSCASNRASSTCWCTSSATLAR